MSSTPEPRITIGHFSLITRLSPRALRLYDERGLLVPRRDRFNNYRYYTTDDIETGLRIRVLTWMGFGVAEIETILGYLEAPEANADRIEILLKRRLAETQIEIQRLRKVEEVLQGKSAYEVLNVKNTEPVVKQVPDVRVIGKRGRGEIGQTFGSLLGAIMGQIYSPDNQRGRVNISGPPMLLYCDPNLGKGKDQPIDLYDIEIEVAVPVTGRPTVDPGFDLKTLPGGRVVDVLHTGPYDEVEGTYALAFDFIGRQGLKVSGPPREIYLNNPGETPPGELLTEIQLPVE